MSLKRQQTGLIPRNKVIRVAALRQLQKKIICGVSRSPHSWSFLDNRGEQLQLIHQLSSICPRHVGLQSRLA